ncbi:MAG: metalloregulator ArsR/SmtB family transcription factor [Planctomycetota bacterium]|nr:metalloregulator ArsR/SmtB family transcription factor [Planctomycetota bacterium]
MVDHSAALDNAFAALADPTRRAILRRLAAGEAPVTELARPFDVSLQAVSKHIAALERAGLVRRRRQGREHLLALNSAPLRTVAQWISFYQRFWETRIDALARLVEQSPGDPEPAEPPEPTGRRRAPAATKSPHPSPRSNDHAPKPRTRRRR